MNPVQTYPANGVVVPNKGDDMGQPEYVGKTAAAAGIYASSGNESHGGAPGHGNDVLEQDAQTKGRWFQYVKTKQFWITLIIGQGTYIPLPLLLLANWD